MPKSPAADLESLLDAFESQCARGPVPLEDLDDFLPAPSDPRRAAHLVELLRVALERRWSAGDKRSIDAFRESHPELFSDVALLGPLAFEEYRLRVQDGERIEAAEYGWRYGVDVRKWPRIEAPARRGDADSPSDDASANEALDKERRWQTFSQRSPEVAKRWQDAAAGQPEVGQIWGDFELVAELGRGAFARVFLARQRSLAGRHVALKLTTGPTVEPAQLARLQHSHIVPIYSVHRQGDLTAVCMPYLGSSTLVDVVRTSRPRNPDSIEAPRGGQAIVSTVVARLAELPTWREDREAPPPELAAVDSPRLQELGRSSYVDAITRIMARTAEGLAHAHERGVLHRDLKPANILLGHDGEPLILDFNLAATTSDEAVGQALVGGTLPYMSPEQLAAVIDGRATDRRSDVFSLGVVLYELLVGRLPHALPPGTFEMLVEHLRRCWEAGPASPRTLNRAIPRGLDAIVRKCLMLNPDERYQTADELAEDLRRQLTHRPLRYAREPWSWERIEKWNKRHPRLASATTVACGALCVVGAISGAWYARGRQLAVARAEERFREFSQRLPQVRVKLAPGVRQSEPAIADDGVAAAHELLASYGVEESSTWREREPVRMLSTTQRETLVRQTDELRALVAAALPTSLQGTSVAPNADSGAASAHGADAGLAADAGALQAAWGRVRERRFSDAIELLDEHLKREPRDAAAWLALGYCHVSRRDFVQAEIAYTMCHSLAPELYVPHYFRGLVRLEKKEFAAAREDFTDTLGLRPELAEAAFHRGLASQGLGEHARAIDDFSRALTSGMRHTRIYFLRSRSYAALGNSEAAQRDLEEGLRREPTDDQSWVARGLARLASDPAGAEQDFRAALEMNPASLPALGNLAHVLSERLMRADEAAEYLGRWIEQYPDDAVARGSRGVLLARRGKFAEATADADAALLRSTVPFVLYQTGCIHALAVRAAEASAEDSKIKARKLLARALRDQPGLCDEMRGDADLATLRDDPAFQRMLDAARTLVDAAGK